MLTAIRAALARRLASEDGISMVAAIMALVVGMSMAAAAFATASSETGAARGDRWQRVAFQRAQTGVSDYINQLSNDPNSWSVCDRARLTTGDGLGVTALNDTVYGSAYTALYGAGNTHPTRRWLPYEAAAADDRALDSQYTIDLIPANGFTSCGTVNEAVAAERMISTTTGTFRIRVTGRAGPPVPASFAGTVEQWRAAEWKRSSIVSEFRRAGFLDYVYFTNHEALDPAFSTQTQHTLIGSIVKIFNPPNFDTCDQHYRYSSAATLGREGVENAGWICPNDRPIFNGEEVRGPVHTNDSFSVQSFAGASAPKFGNDNKGDRVEVFDGGRNGGACSGGGNAAFRSSSCACPYRISGSFAGTGVATARQCSRTQRIGTGVLPITGSDAGFIEMPTGNEELIYWAGEAAPSGHLYEGRTRINLRSDGRYDVTNYDNNGSVIASTSRTGVTYPADGVIYVKNRAGSGTCLSDTDRMYTDADLPGGMQRGCALTEVTGTYNKSLTIGSQSDVVFVGDVQRAGGTNALLGLVANNYVRVRHYAQNGGDENYYKKCVSTVTEWNFIFFSLWIPDYFGWASCMNISGVDGVINSMITAIGDSIFNPDPLVGFTCERESGANGTPVMRIEAAMLALKQTVSVDSANCGDAIGDASTPLEMSGAMTQNYRGAITGKDWTHVFSSVCDRSGKPPGFIAGLFFELYRGLLSAMGWCDNSNHGYVAKHFEYDYLLRALSPPHFLKPNESAWRINRVRQTVPACECGPTG